MSLQSKNRILISIIILTGCLQWPVCQNWFEGSPGWSYDYDGWYCNFTLGDDVVSFVKDTSIDNVDMKLFKVDIYRNQMGIIYSNSHNKLYYEHEDAIYLYANNEHIELYNFSRPIGFVDTIVQYNNEYCDSLIYIRLDSIEMLEVGDNTLRIQKWTIFTDSDIYPDQYIVVEKIGAIGNFPFEAKLYLNCLMYSCDRYEFDCYSNEDIMFNYPTNSSCLDPSQKIGVPSEILQIYPNPTFNYINIETKNWISFVKIYDITGRLLKTTSASKTIDVHELFDGFYIMEVLFRNGDQMDKIFIKN